MHRHTARYAFSRSRKNGGLPTGPWVLRPRGKTCQSHYTHRSRWHSAGNFPTCADNRQRTDVLVDVLLELLAPNLSDPENPFPNWAQVIGTFIRFFDEERESHVFPAAFSAGVRSSGTKTPEFSRWPGDCRLGRETNSPISI